MSGIATYTKDMVKELEGYKTKLLDTRKIIQNIRVFGKYVAKLVVEITIDITFQRCNDKR